MDVWQAGRVRPTAVYVTNEPKVAKREICHRNTPRLREVCWHCGDLNASQKAQSGRAAACDSTWTPAGFAPKFTAAPTMDKDDRKSSDQPSVKRGFDQKWVQRISRINIQCRFIFFFTNDLFYMCHMVTASALWRFTASLNTFKKQILIQNQMWSPRLGFSVLNSNTLT